MLELCCKRIIKQQIGKLRRDSMEKKEMQKILNKNLEIIENLWRSL